MGRQKDILTMAVALQLTLFVVIFPLLLPLLFISGLATVFVAWNELDRRRSGNARR